MTEKNEEQLDVNAEVNAEQNDLGGFSMDVSQIAKSTQEQAVAAWVDYLNQLRLNELLEK